MRRLVIVASHLLLAGVLAACSGSPSDPLPDRPPVPAGWSTVATRAGDLWLALPPWLVPFENQGAIFANEAPGPDGRFLSLHAAGPRAEPQPAPGEDLRLWLERRLEAPGQGPPTASAELLPAGPAMRLDRVDRPGTPTATQIRAFAIRTPAGVVFLLIDGPPDLWARRSADLELLPLLVAIQNPAAPPPSIAP